MGTATNRSNGLLQLPSLSYYSSSAFTSVSSWFSSEFNLVRIVFFSVVVLMEAWSSRLSLGLQSVGL